MIKLIYNRKQNKLSVYILTVSTTYLMWSWDKEINNCILDYNNYLYVIYETNNSNNILANFPKNITILYYE